jgi:flagellar biosynthesis/type III secretory pathway protein FliH
MLDRVIGEFKEEALRNSDEYLQLFTKTLRELKEKKELGEEQQEFRKLEGIAVQLQNFRQQFDEFGKKQGIEDGKMQGMLKGIKGFIKKFSNE